MTEPADHSRSGPDVAAAAKRAAQGTPTKGVQRSPDEATPHTAPVEQVRDDPAMTQGQVVDGPGAGADVVEAPDPELAGSGGAQSQLGARPSDRKAAGSDG